MNNSIRIMGSQNLGCGVREVYNFYLTPTKLDEEFLKGETETPKGIVFIACVGALQNRGWDELLLRQGFTLGYEYLNAIHNNGIHTNRYYYLYT